MLHTFSGGSLELRSEECNVYELANSSDGSFVAQAFLCTMPGSDYLAVTAVAFRLDGHDVYISNQRVVVDGVSGFPAGLLVGGKLQSAGGADFASSSGCHRVNVNTAASLEPGRELAARYAPRHSSTSPRPTEEPQASEEPIGPRWWHGVRIASAGSAAQQGGGGALCSRLGSQTLRRLQGGQWPQGVEPLFSERQVCELRHSAACGGCGSQSNSSTSSQVPSTSTSTTPEMISGCDKCGLLVPEEAPQLLKDMCCNRCFKGSFCEMVTSG